MISAEWWESFQSPELNQVIQLGIKNNYSLQAMQETLNQAQDNYQHVGVRAFVQVSNVLHALQFDDQNIAAQKKAWDSAKASLKLARLGNDVGSSAELEILNAQRLYAQAKLGYVQAIAQRYRDTAQFYLVLGGAM